VLAHGAADRYKGLSRPPSRSSAGARTGRRTGLPNERMHGEMARTVEVRTPTRPPRAAEGTGTVRKTRVMVKRVGPWSVFKFSLLFYFCMMVIVLVALTILYNILSALGAIDGIASFIDQLLYDDRKVFHVSGWWLFTRAFAVGLVMVVFWSLVKLLVTFMYNLISDLVGGLEVTLTERR
jgi:hypothetical protein